MEKQPTPENIRYHAAGHLAAVVALIDTGHLDAARVLLKIIRQYVDHPKVECPKKIREAISACIKDPVSSRGTVLALEEMFCDDLNTQIEKTGGLAGGFGGKG